MNKKILKIIFGMCLLIMLLLYIGAEESLTNPNSVNTNQYNNATLQSDTATILNSPEVNQTICSTDINKNDTQNITELNINTTIDLYVNTTANQTEITEDTTSTRDSSSIEGFDYGNSYENASNYLDLGNVTQENSQQISENINSTENPEYTSLQIQGKKEIDIGDYNGSGITKKEFEKNEYEKEVTVSSEEHFVGYLRVYTSLTSEAKKKDIKVYWKNNENLEITGNDNYSVEYYDENNNGLIDRISWIVPHLSEQIFDIFVNTTNATESQDKILLNLNNPPNGIVNNPIPFNILINYSGETSCNLRINDSVYNFSSNQNYSLNLPNGAYTWLINCSNSTDNSIWKGRDYTSWT